MWFDLYTVTGWLSNCPLLAIKGISDLTINNQLFQLMTLQDPLQMRSSFHLAGAPPPPQSRQAIQHQRALTRPPSLPDGLKDQLSSAVTENSWSKHSAVLSASPSSQAVNLQFFLILRVLCLIRRWRKICPRATAMLQVRRRLSKCHVVRILSICQPCSSTLYSLIEFQENVPDS